MLSSVNIANKEVKKEDYGDFSPINPCKKLTIAEEKACFKQKGVTNNRHS
jgi:hypothetical protein